LRASKIRTLWIVVLSSIYTLNITGQATFWRFLNQFSREWAQRALLLWTKRVLRLVKVNVRVINPNHVHPKANKPTIIMCNHSSHYDIPLSFYAFSEYPIRMLAKKEMYRIPIIGKGMVAAEFPFVDRKNRHQAIKDLTATRALLESGIVLWIAPEGTRSQEGSLAPFKKGGFITAIHTEATIIPIGIRGANQILPARTLQFNLNQTAEIHIGQPIDASEYTLETKDDLIARVYQEMKKLAGQ
jgi:1-acyl-sn-glycerol-3-phosphate acyltransferase